MGGWWRRRSSSSSTSSSGGVLMRLVVLVLVLELVVPLAQRYHTIIVTGVPMRVSGWVVEEGE